MPFLKEIGLFKRNTMGRSLSAPNLKDLTINDRCESTESSSDFGQNHFKKLIGKLTLNDNSLSINETAKLHLNRNPQQEFEVLEFSTNEKAKLKVEEDIFVMPQTAFRQNSVSLQINRDLTSRIKVFDARLKEKDAVIDDYLNILTQIYFGFKVLNFSSTDIALIKRF
jgi:hypothetical protein